MFIQYTHPNSPFLVLRKSGGGVGRRHRATPPTEPRHRPPATTLDKESHDPQRNCTRCHNQLSRRRHLQRSTHETASPASSTQKSLSTKPSKWRTKEERLSICKPAPAPVPRLRFLCPKISNLTLFWALWPGQRNLNNPANNKRQLRPPQVLCHQPHHQGQRPRLRPDLHRQGRRERPLHRREPDLRSVRLCARARRER